MSSRPFILIHGAWHGAWCWQRVHPLLTQMGHQVMMPDLPSLGQDQTPLTEATFASGVEHICDLVNRSSEPVILVGHSLGGMYISQVAEKCPEKIRWLTYLTALLPQDNESVMAIQAANQHPDLFSLVTFDDSSMRLRLPEALSLFYHDCLPADVQRAARLLKPQPLVPFHAPVTLSDRYARVPRAYLACSNDRVLVPELQERFYTTTPCEHVRVLPSGHSPFFAVPTQLAACLAELAWTDPRGVLLAS